MTWIIQDVDDELRAASDFLSVGDQCEDADTRGEYHARARRHLNRALKISETLLARVRAAEAALAEHQAAERALVARSSEGTSKAAASEPPTSVWLTAGETC
jgi:hypothetical protein